MTQATYFLGSRILGTSTFPCPNGGADGQAWFCRTCGEVWARVVCREDDSATSPFILHQAPCVKHAPTCAIDWQYLPGSMLNSLGLNRSTLSTLQWALALEHLPEEVLRREVQLAIIHFEKQP